MQRSHLNSRPNFYNRCIISIIWLLILLELQLRFKICINLTSVLFDSCPSLDKEKPCITIEDFGYRGIASVLKGNEEGDKCLSFVLGMFYD